MEKRAGHPFSALARPHGVIGWWKTELQTSPREPGSGDRLATETGETGACVRCIVCAWSPGAVCRCCPLKGPFLSCCAFGGSLRLRACARARPSHAGRHSPLRVQGAPIQEGREKGEGDGVPPPPLLPQPPGSAPMSAWRDRGTVPGCSDEALSSIHKGSTMTGKQAVRARPHLGKPDTSYYTSVSVSARVINVGNGSRVGGQSAWFLIQQMTR